MDGGNVKSGALHRDPQINRPNAPPIVGAPPSHGGVGSRGTDPARAAHGAKSSIYQQSIKKVGREQVFAVLWAANSVPARNLLLTHSPCALPLHCRTPCDIIRHRKQKCGGIRVRQHPQACTGENTTYTTVPTASAGNIIRHFTLFCKGWSCRICPREHFCRVEHGIHTVRACSARCFCFLPAPRRRRPPGVLRAPPSPYFTVPCPKSGRNENYVRSSRRIA